MQNPLLPHKHCTHICINKYTETHDLNLKNSFENTLSVAGEMTQQFRALAGLAGALSLIPSTHIQWLTTVWHSKLGGSETLSTFMGSCTQEMNTYLHRLTHIHINDKSPRKSKKQNKKQVPFCSPPAWSIDGSLTCRRTSIPYHVLFPFLLKPIDTSSPWMPNRC